MARALIVIAILLLVVAVVVIWVATVKYNKAAWEAAEQNAKWEDFATTKDGVTKVGVRLVAVRGKKRRIHSEEVLWTVPIDDIEWMLRVQQRQFEAINHANVLNEQ